MNKDLYGKPIQLPKEIVEYLETCFNHIGNSDANTEGHNRNQELKGKLHIAVHLFIATNYFSARVAKFDGR